MKSMTTFEENPPNSPANVQERLEAKLDFGSGEVPMKMRKFVVMVGSEKENYGGLVAVKDCLDEFLNNHSSSDTVPTIIEFEVHMFSPVRNHAKVFKHPSTDQKDRLDVISHIPPIVSMLPTMPKIFKVKVYMGVGWETDFPNLDGGKAPDLFAKLSIRGLPVDERKEKTEVKKNCWIPCWDKEFEFLLCSPEDAFLLVDVYDRDRFTRNDFAGTVSLPVSELRMGIRAVPLFDQKGVQCSAARLLMRFMFV